MFIMNKCRCTHTFPLLYQAVKNYSKVKHSFVWHIFQKFFILLIIDKLIYDCFSDIFIIFKIISININ